MNTQKTKGDILADRIENWMRDPDPKYPLSEILAEYHKPWTLGNSVNGFTLGPGQQWHRKDWTEDMLPEGWRPCILGETGGDMQSLPDTSIGWVSATWPGMHGSGVDSNAFHHRTRRPLPSVSVLSPEQIADGWLEWNGGECPVWGGSKPTVMLRSGTIHKTRSIASSWIWANSRPGGDIIAYRPDPYETLKKAHAEGETIQWRFNPAWEWEDLEFTPSWSGNAENYRVKPEPVMVPLGPEDVTPGSAIKHDSWISAAWSIILSVNSNSVNYLDDNEIQFVDFSTLQKEWLINRNDGKGWGYCEKEAK